jgi:proteasome assembly chaperone (PAC2) family protein
MATTEELLNKVSELKSKSDSFSIKRNKGTISGAFIGAAGGLLIAYNKKYSLISSALVGALIGGVTAQLILPKNDNAE